MQSGYSLKSRHYLLVSLRAGLKRGASTVLHERRNRYELDHSLHEDTHTTVGRQIHT
jgi:hypothetical protein